MQLLHVENGKWVRVIRIENNSNELEGKLRQIGLNAGDTARVTRQTPSGGPVLVEINGHTLALGRGVASKIVVEYTGSAAF